MSEVGFLQDSHEISSSYSWSQKNKIKLTAFNVATFLIKWEKSQPKSLQNCVGNIGWCHCGKCHAETQEIDCLCCTDLVALDELKFEGKLFMLFSKIWKIDIIVWNFWDLGFFRMMINFSDLNLISHFLISL